MSAAKEIADVVSGKKTPEYILRANEQRKKRCCASCEVARMDDRTPCSPGEPKACTRVRTRFLFCVPLIA